VQDSEKPKSNNVAGPSVVNMVEHNSSSRYNDNKGKRKHHDNTRADPNKKAKPTCWKCGKTSHIKKDYKGVNVGNKANGSSKKGSVDGLSNSLKGLSQGFWGEAMLTACYLLNSVDTSCVRRRLLEEINPLKTRLIRAHGKRWERRDTSLFLESPRNCTTTKQEYPTTCRQIVFNVAGPACISIDSIMGNNTWVLTDLPPGCKPLGFKWIFKRKLKVDGTIENFKAMLVIQGFKQKSGINYFDTYALVARISTIRLLIAMASIHNLIIHQIDVKTAFLNGKLEEKAPKQWHQKFDEVILFNGYFLTKLRNVLKKLNYFECTPVSTPMDTSEKLIPNNGQAVSQLEYSRMIGCLMYAMTYTRPDIAFTAGKLSRLMYTCYLLVLESYTDASWTNNIEDNLSISGWVFLLGGGAIS
nr:zinc finger, CCHC-type [Tanacetum cinerariifolium]